jgi:hypothetical protein
MAIERVTNGLIEVSNNLSTEALQTVIDKIMAAQGHLDSACNMGHSPGEELQEALGLAQQTVEEIMGKVVLVKQIIADYVGGSENIGQSEVPVSVVVRKTPIEVKNTGEPMLPGHYGQREFQLGVATNRKLNGIYNTSPTEVSYSAFRTYVVIDIEHDIKLQQFLQAVTDSVEGVGTTPPTLSLAEGITRQVAAQTPRVDEDGSYHERRNVTLGEALQQPVECVDRALAIEATLKMAGITDAKMLVSVDEHPIEPARESESHADVGFTLGGTEYVAITMGARAGMIMSKKEYIDVYIPAREAAGLGRRVIKDSWGHEYFQSARPTDSV